MKTQISFLKGILIICLSIFLFFFNCSSDVDVKTVEMQPLTDVLTLELSFGDEKTIEKDEFLLAFPLYHTVADNGDIIVTDEGCLKVYDNDGKPKQIVGRSGQGPGEFLESPRAYVMENGNISVSEMNAGRLSIFYPDYSFHETMNFDNNILYKNMSEENGWSYMSFERLYAFSSNDILIFTVAFESESIYEKKSYSLLLHQQDEKINTIVKSLNENIIYLGWAPFSFFEKGMLVYTLLPGRKIAYSETHKDKVLENGIWYYVIHIYNLDSQERTKIMQQYTPVDIPDNVIHPEYKKGYNLDRIVARGLNPDGSDSFTRRDRDKIRAKYLEELEVYPAIREIFSDKNLLFAKTYKYVKGKGYVYEIFNIETGSYLRSAYFPFDPVIKNGYAYKRARSEEGFSIIEKYRIDPAVYGK